MASSSDGQDVDPKSRVRSNIKQTEEQPWRQELREIMSSEVSDRLTVVNSID